jgi:hypothetical protein
MAKKRLTVELDERIFRRVKATCGRLGISIREYIGSLIAMDLNLKHPKVED